MAHHGINLLHQRFTRFRICEWRFRPKFSAGLNEAQSEHASAGTSYQPHRHKRVLEVALAIQAVGAVEIAPAGSRSLEEAPTHRMAITGTGAAGCAQHSAYLRTHTKYWHTLRLSL